MSGNCQGRPETVRLSPLFQQSGGVDIKVEMFKKLFICAKVMLGEYKNTIKTFISQIFFM